MELRHHFHAFSLAVIFVCIVIEASVIIDVPIIGSSRHRIVSRVTRGLRLNKRQPGRSTQHLKPVKEIDPLPDTPRVTMPTISSSDMKKIIDEAIQTVDQRLQVTEPKIFKNGVVQSPDSPAWYVAVSAKTKIAAKNYSRPALIAEEAASIIARNYRLNKQQITFGLPTVDIRNTPLSKSCPMEVDFPCQPHKYRAFSGHCNNVQNPNWGTSNTQYIRFLSPDYADGVQAPRQSTSIDVLPSTRDISLKVHADVDRPHPHLTALLATFGEFIFHDISHTAQSAGFEGHRIKCCGVDSENFHPECFPIHISASDPLSGLGQTCMEYVRSCVALRTGCTLGPREQVNQVTAFLDGSVIYGSSVEEAELLRTFRGGEMRTQRTSNGKELLPPEDENLDCKSSGRTRCFLAGDVRVNENVGLMVMHTIWVREHNRIARKLATLNAHWDDHQLYEEARRIVGAELQHITYNEFLPAILGQQIVDKYDLHPQASGYFTGYDININPGVSNAVATAVFPFLYSMMPSKFEKYTRDYQNVGSTPMSQTFFDPSDMYSPNKLNQYLLGLLTQTAQHKDEFITQEMTNSVDPSAGEGMDFAAMIIQQGRDHGIPGYVQWRKLCRLSPNINNFKDLNAVMGSQTADKLAKIYKTIHDIDLFTGGLAETPIAGAVVGPTFACLLGRQFYYLRRGDRYWYENDIPPSSFTREQLAEIRKVTLARIVCDNADSADYVQPSSMFVTDPFLNAFQYCGSDNIPHVDLTKWKTGAPHFVVPERLLKESLRRAKRQAEDLRLAEKDAFSRNVGIAADKSPEAVHLGFLRPKRQAQVISNQSIVFELASRGFVNKFLSSNQRDRERGVSRPRDLQELMSALPDIDVSDFLDRPNDFDCEELTLPCDHTSRFRTYSGWCNNLQNPEWGQGLRIFQRLLPPNYQDGIGAPRSIGVSNKPLPNPRIVSTTIHYDVSAPHVRYALVLMQWGQFLDHDLTFTPMNTGFGGSILDCKDCNSPKTVHPQCLPIPIPPGDPYFPEVNSTTSEKQCISFVRSLNGQTTLGPREQLNQVTSFLDASNIYGSEKCEARMLRSFIGGRLNVTRNPLGGLDLLPQTATHMECRAPSGLCFEAGDMRASEQPGLACMHTMFMREHNRVVEQLQKINPHWNDEQLYQNGRRILSASLQHITYNEFLPRVLGWEFIHRYGLNLQPEGYYDGYDDKCNPTIFNEFAAAVFRFGHSLIKPSYERLDREFRPVSENLQLRKGFFNSDMLYAANAIDHIVRGLVTSSIENLDNSITKEVTNHLFEDRNIPFSGMDLVAFNIQRARDHGLNPYNHYRELCNLTRARSFDDLSKEIPIHLIEKLKTIYNHVDDIDLFTGGLIETANHGGLVGPTFGCIIGLQFQMLKKCDRFWYETSNPLVRFTEAQLTELRKVSLARVICDNTNTIDTIQRTAMDLPDPFLNPRVSCRSLPAVDLEQWKERVSCSVNDVNIQVGDGERISPCVMCTCTKEGPICQSLKVSNCLQLATTFSQEAILADSVCKVQCAYAFRAFPQVDLTRSTTNNNILGFSSAK